MLRFTAILLLLRLATNFGLIIRGERRGWWRVTSVGWIKMLRVEMRWRETTILGTKERERGCCTLKWVKPELGEGWREDITPRVEFGGVARAFLPSFFPRTYLNHLHPPVAFRSRFTCFLPFFFIFFSLFFLLSFSRFVGLMLVLFLFFPPFFLSVLM